MSAPPSTINQSGAEAGRDIVAGDKVDHHYYLPTAKGSVVEELMVKLQNEMKQDSKVTTMIDELCRYHQHKAHDGVNGLEAKLQKGKRSHEIEYALEQKEMFAKMLEKWAMYTSAQEIFVHLLARAEHEYRTQVLPQFDSLTEVQVNEVITSRIVQPVVADCGDTIFKLNHGTAMGMFYWLAEQCFVRWHK